MKNKHVDEFGADDEMLDEILEQLHPTVADYIRHSDFEEESVLPTSILGDELDEEEIPYQHNQHRSIIVIRWISHLIPIVIVLISLLALIRLFSR